MSEMHDRIKELRMSHGYTLSYVAEYLEVTEATAQRYETGKGIKSIPYDVLEKYGQLFNCNPSYFLGWNQDLIDEQTEIMKDKNEYFDKYEAEFKEFMDELFELSLTSDELNEVSNYAKYIKSKRKE